MLPALLTGKTIFMDKGNGELKTFLDHQDNIGLLGAAVGLIVKGNDDTVVTISRALESTASKRVPELGLRVRQILTGTNVAARLARLFDEELQRVNKESTGSFSEKAVLLQMLMVVSNEPELRSQLKGRLRN